MLDKLKIIDFPKIEDPRGNLTFVQQNKHIPFAIERVYWIYDVPGGQVRGGHAFKKQQEVIVALSGSFDVLVNNGKQEVSYTLNRSYFGLYIPNGIWRSLQNFSTNAVALVLSSTRFSESDYIRNYEQYKHYLNVANE
ncbi:FdtA/QdtA family cupin domain-containing protein [uncultured Draconibacterium sp.]|uniref:sugar 3,4-ketoisomerase n=1 Tax=uncultured Draconibacterium sp. TaxID=1573823 RepID=UPI0025E8AFA8|nr:FdtA/QdtA family cupin domain-containing protein [uncultured Draconibacterium sp.]